MKNSKNCVLIGMVFMGFFISCSAMAKENQEKKAAEGATTWLALIDEGNYRESWETAAGYFKNAVAKQQWELMLKAARQPLGKLISRVIKSTVYRKSLPGAPDGEYVIIQFESSFENKKSGIETVTPMLDKVDGEWKVSGYYIQ